MSDRPLDLDKLHAAAKALATSVFHGPTEPKGDWFTHAEKTVLAYLGDGLFVSKNEDGTWPESVREVSVEIVDGPRGSLKSSPGFLIVDLALAWDEGQLEKAVSAFRELQKYGLDPAPNLSEEE